MKYSPELFAEELAKADHWVTITSTEGELKMFSNSCPMIIFSLLFHAMHYLETTVGEDDEGEQLLPPTIQ